MSGPGSVQQGFQELEREARLGALDGEPVPVEPRPLRFYGGSILLVVLGLAGLLGGGLLLGSDRGGGLALMVFGAVLGGIGGAILAVRAMSRGTVRPHQNGFVWERGSRRRAVLFDEMVSLTLVEKELLNNGVRVGLNRRLVVRGPLLTLRLAQSGLDGHPDPMGAFLDSLLSKLAALAETRVASGGDFAGDGWRLGPDGLRGKRLLPTPLTALVATGTFENRVSVWREGEEMPALSVPAGSANAVVLQRVVQRHLERAKRSPVATQGLGRVLFRKGTSTAALVLCALLALGTLAFGVAAFFQGPDGPAIGATVSVVGLAIGVAALVMARSRVTFHQRGAVKRGLLAGRTLLYADVSRLTYGVTRNYYNGAYTGTTFDLAIAPEPPAKGIRLRTTVRGSDDDLDALKNLIAALVAERMHVELKRRGETVWTQRLRFTKDGLVLAPGRFFGPREARVIPCSEALGYKVADGRFSLFVPGEKKAAVSMPCSEPNFYPGFLLLERLVTGEGEEAPA